MQQPENISEFSKDTVCFFMFLDEETEAAIKNTTKVDNMKRIGLWRVVVVHNLPYSDARRNGKVPAYLDFLFSLSNLGVPALTRRCISAQVKFQLSRRCKLQVISVKIIITVSACKIYVIFEKTCILI